LATTGRKDSGRKAAVETAIEELQQANRQIVVDRVTVKDPSISNARGENAEPEKRFYYRRTDERNLDFNGPSCKCQVLRLPLQLWSVGLHAFSDILRK
jgi:hypothetical protein